MIFSSCSALEFAHIGPVSNTIAAVALTQISAYSTHKNLAVRKIMEAMRTAYARKRASVSTRLKQHKRQAIAEGTRVL